MANAINWFEIPATDFARAKSFYETILDTEIMEMPFPHGKYGMFPADMQSGGVGGGLMQSEGFIPSKEGTVVYLNGGEDLSGASRRKNCNAKNIYRTKWIYGTFHRHRRK